MGQVAFVLQFGNGAPTITNLVKRRQLNACVRARATYTGRNQHSAAITWADGRECDQHVDLHRHEPAMLVMVCGKHFTGSLSDSEGEAEKYRKSTKASAHMSFALSSRHHCESQSPRPDHGSWRGFRR